jgi:large subunit ribosomal protein L25
MDSMPLAVGAAEFSRLLRQRSGTLIIDLKLEGGGDGDRLAVIRGIQRDPASGEVLHLDFQRISLKEKVHVQVPLQIVGTAPGVKDEGGILEHPLRHLDIKCMPNQIPDHIDVDVSGLHIGHSIHVRDLVFDLADIELLSEPEMVVVTVSAPRVVKSDAELAAEAAAAAAEAEPGAEGAAEGEEEKEGGKGEEKKPKEKGREKE